MSKEYLWEIDFSSYLIAGLDEVGRGCLAGPVVTAIVLPDPEISLEKHKWVSRVRDSKTLKAEAREDIFHQISTSKCQVAVGYATAKEIDRINIRQATHLAMERAFHSLKTPPKEIRIDGIDIPKGLRPSSTLKSQAVVKGDQKIWSIAAASVVAKFWRDTWMSAQDEIYPGYGFTVHKGYPTPFHKDAIKRLGPSPLHRMTFGGVKEYGPGFAKESPLNELQHAFSSREMG